MTREKLGSMWTDTATLLIGDPCQFAKDEGVTPKFTYTELMRLRGRHRENYTAFVTPGREGVLVDVETDGFYPVFLVRNSRGEAVRLEIQLGGQVGP